MRLAVDVVAAAFAAAAVPVALPAHCLLCQLATAPVQRPSFAWRLDYSWQRRGCRDYK